MAKSKKTEEVPPEIAPPTPIPDTPDVPSPPVVDTKPEAPENQVPDVIINNDPNAVMATEAEKAQGIMPKSTPDAPRGEDFAPVELPAE